MCGGSEVVRGMAVVLLFPAICWSAPGDFDGDGDVDLVDHAVLVDCLEGPGTAPDPTPPTTPGQCLTAFDGDGDLDVDLHDFGFFSERFTGSLPRDCNSNGTPDNADLDSRASFDCNTNGIPDECDIRAGTSQDCDSNGVPDTCLEFGMAVENVEAVQTNGMSGFAVTTTGGVFEIMPTHVQVRRRISLETNEVEPNPPLMARITFDGNGIGPLVRECETRQSCRIVSSNGLEIDVRADSLVFLRCANSNGYTYESLLADPTWAERSSPSDYGNQMWAKLGEGHLHMTLPGTSGVAAAGADPANQIDVDLHAGQQTAFAVFPSRPRPVEYLYGEGARPHTVFIYFTGALPTDPDEFQDMASNGFGSLVLFGSFYADLDANEEWCPDVIDSNGLLGYVYQDPAAIRDFVDEAHSHGFKVLTYMAGCEFGDGDMSFCRPPGAPGQPVEMTLNWMRAFQEEYDLDGWYLDGACAAGADWSANYEFIRAVRRQVGDDGIIYHHCSYDEWGGGSGNVAFAPLEAWESYTLRGEWEDHSQVTGPNDQFLVDMCGSHGGQLALHKVRSTGADMLTAESTRLFQQNLWNAYRCSILARQDWPKYGQPHWRARQAEYLSSPEFSMTVDWPPQWYHESSGVTTETAPTSITVHFQTGAANTYGEIRVVKNWSGYPGYHFDYLTSASQILEKRYSCTYGPEHDITINNLQVNTEYRILVRGYMGTIGPSCGQAEDTTMLHDVYGTAIVVRMSRDCNGNGIGDPLDIAAGTSDDCNSNGIPDECDLAGGTGKDCNLNGILDSCDIAAGTSQDCNHNSVPDECGRDCNHNGLADTCDIAAGTSSDCNANRRPDECDIAAGTSADCNSNGTPDACEPDCNGNSIPDSCDMAAGTSSDCNANGIPDECDLATSQWASTLIAVTSEWGPSTPPPGEDWSGARALGPPDVPYYGDHPNAWACLEADEGYQSIIVGFTVPVYGSGLTVVETYNVGFVRSIDLQDEFGRWQIIWSGMDPSSGNEVAYFHVDWPKTSYLITSAAVAIDTDQVPFDWEETDAIRLHGSYSLDVNTNGVPDECE